MGSFPNWPGVGSVGRRNAEGRISTNYGDVYVGAQQPLSEMTLFSAEASSEHPLPIMELAADREHFVELVSKLPPLIQDIFFQYYLLGRTFDQIGAVLFPQKPIPARRFAVHIGTREGLRSLCSVIRGEKLEVAKYRARCVKLQAPKSFGEFAVTPNGDLSELFSPSWSVIGCRGSGTRAQEC